MRRVLSWSGVILGPAPWQFIIQGIGRLQQASRWLILFVVPREQVPLLVSPQPVRQVNNDELFFSNPNRPQGTVGDGPG